MTVEELSNNGDWEEVFGEGSGGNCTRDTEAVGECDPTPPARADIEEILALREGRNDELSWMGVFLLNDGRFLYAEGSCDSTGWHCHAGNSLTVASDLRS